MRATILPEATILTKAHWAAVNGLGEYCGLSTASEVFLIFTTQLYQYFSVFLLFVLFGDKPEVFLPKYSQTAILHAAHFQRVVNTRPLSPWYRCLEKCHAECQNYYR